MNSPRSPEEADQAIIWLLSPLAYHRLCFCSALPDTQSTLASGMHSITESGLIIASVKPLFYGSKRAIM